jgi:hypothetical protein
MTGWRSGDLRPSEGERVAVTMFDPPRDRREIAIGAYWAIATFSQDGGWRFPWSVVRAWIPESELVEQSELVLVKGESR